MLDILVALLLALQGKKSIAKVRQISSPQDLMPWAQTYSVLSLYMVRILQATLVCSIIFNVMNVVSVAFGSKFASIDISEQCDIELKESTLLKIYSIVKLGVNLFEAIIFLL